MTKLHYILHIWFDLETPVLLDGRCSTKFLHLGSLLRNLSLLKEYEHILETEFLRNPTVTVVTNEPIDFEKNWMKLKTLGKSPSTMISLKTSSRMRLTLTL